jgi:anti-sigma factor RsiW
MSESCRDWRGDLAAAALGNLDDEARVALQAHLDGCAACRAELDELSAVAAALPAADVTRIAGSTAEPPPDLVDQVSELLAEARADERQLDRVRGRRRVFVAIGTAAAAVAAGIGLLVLGASLGSSTKADREVAFTVAPPGVEAVAELRDRDYGTDVTLEIDGLDDGDTYWLWLTGADGDRVGAGTFTARDDHFTCEMTAAIPLDATRRVWVTNTADETVLDVEF